MLNMSRFPDFSAEAVDGLNQRQGVFGGRKLGNSMAKIEHMTRAAPKRGKDFIYLSSDHFRGSEQNCRVEITLQGDLLADKPAGFSNIHRPVNAHCIATAVCNAFQP
jgi:hypothetical protein